MKNTLLATGKKILLLLSAMLVCAMYRFPVVLGDEPNAAPPGESPILHMASIFDSMPGVNTEDARMALEMLMRDIVVRQGNRFRITLDFLMEFDRAAERIAADRFDLVILPGLDYLQIRQKVALFPRLVLAKVDQPTEPLVLVTRRSETLDTLKKKESRILILDAGRSGQNAKLWLDTVLLEAGKGPSDQFFTEIHRSQKPSRSILPVFFGQAAACVVPESALNVMKELNPQIGQQVQVAKRSVDLVNLLLCATSWAKKEDVEMVVAEGVEAMRDPKSRQALTMVQMNRFYAYEPGYMAGTEDLYKRYQRAMKKWGL